MPVLHDEVIKSLTFLRLPERHQASTDDLEVIIDRFPNVINSDDLKDLEAEFLDYQAAPNTELPAYFDEDDKPIRIDQVWHKVSLLNDAFSGLPRFKHLAKLAKVLLLIPHSNATVRVILAPSVKFVQLVGTTLERMLLKAMPQLVYTKTPHQSEITYLAF
jgi:hypothetical protein